MVIDDDDLRDALQEHGRGDEVRDVRIDDEKYGIQGIDALHILGVNEHSLVLGRVLQNLDELVDAVVHIAQDDVHGLLEVERHLRHADRRTEAVEVLVVVTHDEDLVRVLDDLAHGVGDDARLDARMLLDRLRLAAEELVLAAHAHGDLVAAAPEREVKPCLRLPAKLLHRLLLGDGKPHGQRQRQAVRALQGTHAIEDVEMLPDRTIERLPLDHGDVEIVAHAAHEAAETLEPFVETAVRLEEQRSALRLRKPLHDLVEIVDLDVGENGAAVLEKEPQLLVFRPILDVERHEPLDVVRRHDRAIANLVIVRVMGEDILAGSPPNRLQDDPRPEILERKARLGRLPQIILHGAVRPRNAPFGIDDDDRLRQALDREIRHLAHVAHDIAAVSLERAMTRQAALTRKERDEQPDDESDRRNVGIVVGQHQDERQQNGEMNAGVQPRRQISRQESHLL